MLYAHYRVGNTDRESLSISTEYGMPIARFISLFTPETMERVARSVGFKVIGHAVLDHSWGPAGYTGLKGQLVSTKARIVLVKSGDGKWEGPESQYNTPKMYEDLIDDFRPA